jgi:hypothetical protein
MDAIKTHLPTRLLAAAEEFLRREGGRQSLPDLAREVLGDRGYFSRLRGSRRGIHSRSYDRFQAHFLAHGHDPDELARAGAAAAARRGTAGGTAGRTAKGAAGSGQAMSGKADHGDRVPGAGAGRIAQERENCA